MKIYFAASVRGGRGDVEIYAEIIELLKNYGEVITAYLGKKELTAEGETKVSDKKVYERDVAWLESADVLIAEVSTPSLGVGYELAYAEKLGKKVFCLYHEGSEKRLSNMISGNKYFQVKTYTNIDDVSGILKEFFK